jgi:DNA-binding MarR family transcriptional regulator
LINRGNCPYIAHTSDFPPELCNCSALRQAARHVTKLYDDALAPLNLGVNQYSILVRLHRLGPSALQALARALVTDRSTLGHLLRPLEARGLVRIETAKDDRRGRTLRVTQAGLALIAQARPLWARAQRRFEGRIGTEAAAGLRGMLKRIAVEDFGEPKRAVSEA